MSKNNQPSVSIGIPAYNEEKHIEGVIRKFQRSAYPNIVEILIADGQSIDRTTEIVKKISTEDQRVKLVENPDRNQSAGLNKLIDIARGELFLRADAHCDYADNYVEASVTAFQQSGALNVGGAQRFVATHPFQAYVALAVESILGSGGAKYRNREYTGYADTVFLGCYKTEILQRLNGFLTSNITNEDAELNIRLEKVQNNAIYISPDIHVWYHPRNDLASLFKQYFRYGQGRCLTVLRHFSKMFYRGNTPFLTTFLLVVLTAIFLFSGRYLVVAGIAISIFLMVLLVVIYTVVRTRKYFITEIWRGPENRAPGWLRLIAGTFIVILVMNLAHFAGYGWQLLRLFAGKKTFR